MSFAKNKTCDFCGKECTANHSDYRVAGAAQPHAFCRTCLDPDLPHDEQWRRGAELIIVLVDRAVDEGGNCIVLPGHA